MWQIKIDYSCYFNDTGSHVIIFSEHYYGISREKKIIRLKNYSIERVAQVLFQNTIFLTIQIFLVQLEQW